MFRKFTRTSLAAIAAAGLGLSFAGGALAQDTPGEGVTVIPLKSSIAEETFQTVLVMKALEELGYDEPAIAGLLEAEVVEAYAPA